MTILEKQTLEQMGPLPEIHHDHDLVNELSKRLDAVCQYAENIAHSKDDPELEKVWRELEQQEQLNIRKLKEMIVKRIDKGVFLEDL
jgi:hypothetical protein